MANSLILTGTTSLELSAKGSGSDVRSWAANKVGVEGARLFINNISQQGNVDTIINRNRGNVGIGTSNPSAKLTVETGSAGPLVLVRNTSATGNGIRAESQGGHGLSGASNSHTGTEGFSESGFGIHGGSSRSAGVRGESNNGTGVSARVVGGAFIYEGFTINDRKFAVTRNGDVLADGAHTGPADFAEMLPVSGPASDYEPGDVLVIGPDGKLAKVARAYASNLAGVYSAAPGFVGDVRITERGLRDAGERGREEAKKNWIPVALLGIVPVKVSDENGPVRPGDLLTTSETAGHAMRAEPVRVDGVEIFPTGTILGKALEPLESGRKKIRALVTLK